MPCPKTQHLLIEYFDENMSAVSRDEITRHIEVCAECATEYDALMLTQHKLGAWQNERVPHWDRGTALFRQENGRSPQNQKIGILQWLPASLSFAMFCILVFNISISSNEDGFTLSFGGNSSSSNETPLELRLDQFATQQKAERDQILQAFLVRMDERLDSNNLRVMQAVMDQTQALTAENFDQIYSYFEQQRQLDMESVQVGYQQLVDSDYDTLKSMEQLANFIRFQGELR